MSDEQPKATEEAEAGADDEAASFKVVVRPPADNPHGIYCNFAQIRVTDYDFVLDFAQIVPPADEAEVAAARLTGQVVVPGRVRVVIPVPVMPALINALRTTFTQFAKDKGLSPKAQEMGNSDAKH